MFPDSSVMKYEPSASLQCACSICVVTLGTVGSSTITNAGIDWSTQGVSDFDRDDLREDLRDEAAAEALFEVLCAIGGSRKGGTLFEVLALLLPQAGAPISPCTEASTRSTRRPGPKAGRTGLDGLGAGGGIGG